MTYAPQTLIDLAHYWISEGGVNLGIVGDTEHQAKGVSYHLGRDQLQPGAYSATRPRDRAGLTNAASAIDLGKLNGSYSQLRAFSDWLARRCVKGDPGTNDVVEVIYSPDGKRVLGFKDGIAYLIPDYGDASHLTHTHISFFRDSEKRDKRPLFEPYFLPDTNTEPDVTTTITPVLPPLTGTVTAPGTVTVYLPDGTAKDVTLAAFPADAVEVVITQSDNKAPHGQFRRLAARPNAGYYVASNLVTYTGPDPTANCDDAVQAELERASVRASAAVLAR